MPFEFDDTLDQQAKMKVVGVGGGGGNATNQMILSNLEGVDFIIINTDAQDLEKNQCDCRIQIGRDLTKGLGAGANPEIGKKAAEMDKDSIRDSLGDSDMVFIAAGMGGGTGTGAAPIVAEVARELGALTIAIVTKPFPFEGKQRMKRAEKGIEELREKVDTLIVIPNIRLLSIAPKDMGIKNAFKLADEVLLQATKGISDLITKPGLINLDFADVRTTMSNKGDALIGIGIGRDEDKAAKAAQQAISSPLLEDISIAGAEAILVNVTGGEDMSLHEVNEATTIIYEAVSANESETREANIIFGTVVDEKLQGEIQVTVIATGFNKINMKQIEQNDTKSTDFTPKDFDQYEEPAYKRKTGEQPPEQKPRREKDEEQDDRIKSLDDLEIPTFLRRQMD